MSKTCLVVVVVVVVLMMVAVTVPTTRITGKSSIVHGCGSEERQQC